MGGSEQAWGKADAPSIQIHSRVKLPREAGILVRTMPNHSPGADTSSTMHTRRHNLAVGFFSDHHHPPRWVEVDGERLGSIVRLVLSDLAPDEAKPITEHLTLYHTSSDLPYVVHCVQERCDRNPQILGVLDRFESWKEMERQYPSLARRALEIARDWGLGGSSRPPQIEVVNSDDPSVAFG